MVIPFRCCIEKKMMFLYMRGVCIVVCFFVSVIVLYVVSLFAFT